MKTHENGVVELLTPEDRERPGATQCGTCLRWWDDDHVTGLTPAPSGRCPFEYDHEAPAEEGDIRATRRRAHLRAAGMEHACRMLVDTIEATGGVDDEEGGVAADPEWIDLRDAYDAAKAALVGNGTARDVPALERLARNIVRTFRDAIENDEPINGADLVDYLTGQLYPQACEALGEVRP